MANQPEIKNAQKTALSSLYTVKALGGDIDMAIVQARASMEPEDVAAVEKEFKAWEEKQNKSSGVGG
jgi:hypothetical protein